MPASTPEQQPQPDRGHAVSRLRATRIAASSKPFVARGANPLRCSGCRLPPPHCICEHRPSQPSRAGFCLLMGDIEALKPSNTGWLIADVVADTWAFQWSRTEVDPALLALLQDPQWQPFVVFPPEYSSAGRVVSAPPPVEAAQGRRPLYVLLDGTWSEARKMFRKSPYLDGLPVLGLHPETASRYRLRRSAQDHHFCTAEIAALCLDLAGDERAAEALDAWFGLFSEHYLSARGQGPLPADSPSRQRLRDLVQPCGMSGSTS
ncbi:tRNA-uridine aminocarboxypropyltransferase [Hydrogenophaga sp.]|uniref:tRNA-uridine aminocarboxypropyltransferase n=1 Tax=Hydrogenophaga sp. TaxID=1904254 RepID=UPI0035AE486A